MEISSKRSRKGERFLLSAIAVVVASTFSTGVAMAQEDAEKDATKLDAIEVTGSRIKRSDYETASPVQIIDRKAIEASGKLNIADVIRGVSADGQGSIPMAFSAGFAAGSQAVSLRGLGVNSTLVLLNGRRTAPYGLADDGSHVFTDLNTIPLEAVERIEILKDGASAIYGSDAVGGVINIILRNNYEGASLGGSYGISSRGDGENNRLNGIVGFGNLDRDGYNGFFSVEYSTTDAIGNADRGDYLGTNDLRPYGWFDNRSGANAAGFGDLNGINGGALLMSRNSPFGLVPYQGDPADQVSAYQWTHVTQCGEVDPQTGTCLWDPIDFEYIQPEEKKLNLMARGTFKLGDSAELYGEASWFRSRMFAIGTPTSFTFGNTYNPNDPVNPLFPLVRPVLPADHPQNQWGTDLPLRYLAVDAGGRNQRTNNEVSRLLVGVKGDVGLWNYDVGALYTESKLENTNYNFVQFTPLQAALDAGTYFINDRASTLAANPNAYNEIFPALINKPKTSVTQIDASLSGSLFDLPGGPMSVAIGAEWRKEKADAPPVPGTDTGEVAGLGYSAFNSDRKIYAGYVEVEAPLFNMLTANAALRYDHYSDYGNSTTPKFGLKFQPMDWLALRGTYSEAFRAPGPTESGNSATLGFTNIAIVTTGDPSVQPEEAKSYTLGLVAEPVPGTTITIDYYEIKRENEIVQADQAAIVGDNPTTGQAANAILPGQQPNSFLYYDEEGNLAAISGPYANANKTNTTGIDIDFSQKFDLDEWGRLIGGITLTHVYSFERQLADGSKYEYAGTHGPYALSSASGTPQDRAVANLTWERGDWSATLTMNYVGPMDMIDHQGETLQEITPGYYATTTYEAPGFGYVVQPGEPACGVYSPDGTAPGNCKLSSFTTFDLFGKVAIGQNWELSGTVLNLFDRMAPFDPYTYGGTNYNVAFHQAGAVGRFYSMGVKYSFQ
ncbi:MAG: TonB-dependent receptor [Nevskiales bacterium]|nr:TonB-dependent receptor [Nevskiales bacterium]